MASQNATVLNVRLKDEALVEMLDVVVTYESTLQGLTRGQAVFDLMLKGAELESYPLRVRNRIEEAEQGRGARAVRESLAVPRRGKVA